jgi:hypothetical protein
LSNTEEIRKSGVRGARSDPGDVVDEVSSICDLSTNIAELGNDTKEECVVLSERLVFEFRVGCRLLSLVGHVGIGDFWNWSEEENDGEEENDTEVDPLSGLKGSLVLIIDVLEDDLGCEGYG